MCIRINSSINCVVNVRVGIIVEMTDLYLLLKYPLLCFFCHASSASSNWEDCKWRYQIFPAPPAGCLTMLYLISASPSTSTAFLGSGYPCRIYSILGNIWCPELSYSITTPSPTSELVVISFFVECMVTDPLIRLPF